jgi:16S rRNA (adenine1518-N6/adenine1519-N6)-dimethyltransferase
MASESRSGAPASGRPPPVRKSLGQHFLNDQRILERIADAGDVAPGDTVIEIGPGRGSLTSVLAGRGARVIGVEYDRMLVALLRDRFAGESRVTVVQADVLAVALASLVDGPFKVIGNVPYNITTPILFHALASPRPVVAVFLVQREVAERIVAPAGARAYGALSVNIQAVARPSLAFRVAPGSFTPPPKVESAVVRLVPRDDPAVEPAAERQFREMVQALFGMRRKQMVRAIRERYDLTPDAAATMLRRVGIAPDARVETVGVDALAALFGAVPPPRAS